MPAAKGSARTPLGPMVLLNLNGLFLSTGGTSTGADAKGPRTLILQQLLIVKSFTHLE